MSAISVDLITQEIVEAALTSAAQEMGGALKFSSYSPIIRDMEDFSCAIFTFDGDLVAQADYIPAQLGAMSLVVKSVIKEWHADINDNDIFICNHPYQGAMHLPDINVVAPVFFEGEIVAWAGTAAHHIDVGGVNPGSEGPDLKELFAEGLVIPPTRLYIKGEENIDLVKTITANIRDPLSTISDLRAQRAACNLGRNRVLELIETYGNAVLQQVFVNSLDSVEAAIRYRLRELSDGVGDAIGYLDDDGRNGPPTKVRVQVTKLGDSLTVDLSGSDPQVAGAMNVPWSSTRAGIVYAVRTVLAPELGTNDGLLRALNVICPQGNVLNPFPPAAVSVRHNTCQRFADTAIRALVDLWPDLQVAGSSVTFFGCNIGTTSPSTGQPTVLADVVGGGTGASSEYDGLDGVDTYMSNVGLMPVEVLETNYQVRVLKTELIDGSGGVGQHHGGMGIRREYQILEHSQHATFYAEQTNPEFVALGRNGGGDGAPAKLTLLDKNGDIVPIASKVSMDLEPGSVIRVETSGGGGFGLPE
jgi:N-methylhydantoinase B